MSDKEQLSYDVVVVGGGLAALRAAISAREAGASVAVAVKGLFGRSGSSAMTTGGFAAVIPGLNQGDTPEIHARDTVQAGWGIGDPELVRIICEQAAGEVEYMQKFGGRFFRETSGELYVEPSGEHSYARVLVPENHIGTDFTVPMAEYAKRLGVDIFENTMCLEVAVADGKTEGIVTYGLKTNKLLFIAASSVILCTGGCGNLFSFTSNPRDVTGDGYALAYEAGAELRDMEFIQFYPWRCIEPFDKARVSVQPPTFVKGGKLFNAAGERFMEQYDPQRIDGTTRDLAARGIYDQIRKGLDIRGGVKLDVSGMTEETFQRYNPKMWKALQAKKLAVHGTEFIIAPEAHYFMGGVKIDSFGRSSVEGLYAAGETAGGIHGANRANSNALPEILVISARSGAHAAEYALNRPRPTAEYDLSGWDRLLESVNESPGEPDYKTWTRSLKETMDRSMGIIRNEHGIVEGLAKVADWKAGIDQETPKQHVSFRSWFELKTLFVTAENCLTAALTRKESRGAHFREDYDRASALWERVSVVIRRSPNGPAVSFLADGKPIDEVSKTEQDKEVTA